MLTVKFTFCVPVVTMAIRASILASLFALTRAHALVDSLNSGQDVIQRDVVIIGGGASGAHAAVRLREDFKKSVILVEKQSILVRSSLLRVYPKAAPRRLTRNVKGGHV